MPFQSTTNPDDLRPDPAVRIFFVGLMIIKPDDQSRSCEVFVHRSAPDHHLTIETRRKRPGRPDEIMMRHIGPLSFVSNADGSISDHGFIIEKLTGGSNDVKKYVGPETAEGLSLERAINLQAAPFHAGANLKVDLLGARPSISVNGAVFYTADLTREELDIKLKRGGAEVGPLEPFASLIGANIYLDGDEDEVVLTWLQQGRLQGLTMKREAGVSYEVYIANDPLYENDTIEENRPLHDEFKEYYKILAVDEADAVPTSDQFRLDVTPPPAGTPRGSTRAPCMSVLLDR
jgi:hypothetical protein